MIQQKYREFQLLLNNKKHVHETQHEHISKIDASLKFNTEHTVPLSWFSAKTQ